MIDLNSKKELVIDGQNIATTFDSSSGLTRKRKFWDLTQLKGITTYSCVIDDEARKLAEHKLEMRNNLVTGALVGGILDAASGEDSPLDGILLGAVFGAACTGNPEKGIGKIGLIFLDGSHLALEVNVDEYSSLQAIAEANLSKPRPTIVSPISERGLNNAEMNAILQERAISKAFSSFLLGAILMTAGSNIPWLLFDSKILASIGLTNDTATAITYSVFALLSIWIAVKGLIGVGQPEVFLRSESERKAYSSQVKQG